MAAGRVMTGFSLPYVALYTANGGTVTYSQGQRLARGVQVSIEAEAEDDNIFYADNISAESAPGIFTSGTATFTVDGLKLAAEQLIMGIPAADSQGFIHYGESLQIPYVGVGFICRYMEDGVTSYVPYILTKCRFVTPGIDAQTATETIEWQTQEITATLLRDDTSNHDWKLVGAEQTSEALAEAKIKTIFNIT
jgi:phi13 family phage major tail protein